MPEAREFRQQQEKPFLKKALWWLGFGAVGVIAVGAAVHL